MAGNLFNYKEFEKKINSLKSKKIDLSIERLESKFSNFSRSIEQLSTSIKKISIDINEESKKNIYINEILRSAELKSNTTKYLYETLSTSSMELNGSEEKIESFIGENKIYNEISKKLYDDEEFLKKELSESKTLIELYERYMGVKITLVENRFRIYFNDFKVFLDIEYEKETSQFKASISNKIFICHLVDELNRDRNIIKFLLSIRKEISVNDKEN